MKRIFIAVWLLLSCTRLFSQSTADSLKKLLQQETLPAKQIERLISISDEYRVSDTDSSFYYATKAQEKLAGKKDTLQSARAALNIAYYYNINGQSDKSLSIIDATIKELGPNYQNNSITAQHYSLSGICFMKLDQKKAALERFYKALQIAENIGDHNTEVRARANIGWVMMETNQFEKAIQSIRGAIETTRKNNITNIKSAGVLYNNMASCFGSLNQLDSAQKYAQLGIEFSRKHEDIAGEANGLFILGTAYEKQGNFSAALESFQKAQPIREKAGDPFFIVSDLAEISSLYARMGKTDEGIATSEKALKIAKENKLDAKLPMIYSSLASNYEAKGDYKNALKTYKVLNDLKDSIYDDANPKALAEMQTRYETEKKEQQILLQKSELDLKQSELVRKNITLAAIIVLALLGVLLLWSWFRRQQLKIRAARQAENIRQQELATKAVLEAEERERQRIAKDLHDGVGQIMSAAKMNLSAFENELLFANPEQKLKFEKIIDLVDESCKEVRSVSHNMMPNALLKTGLTAAIREFIDKIDYSVLKVELSSEGLNERLDSNTETVLYRVIQECVNNVIKHSGANHLDISLIKDSDGISATIEDNGKGFDSKDNSKYEGLGLKNIRTRVEYLKGSVEFDSKPGKGTLVAIHIPAMTG